MSARPVSVASDGDCMANTKDSLVPVGLNKTSKNKCCCVPGCGKTSNVVVCLLILMQYVRQQMLV